MDALTSLGLILLLALLAGHLVKTLRIPEVTGYILVGIALGPSILGWVSTDNLAALEVLSQVALGLILFSVGSVFEVFQVPAHGPAVHLSHARRVAAGVRSRGGWSPRPRPTVAGRLPPGCDRHGDGASLDADGHPRVQQRGTGD